VDRQGQRLAKRHEAGSLRRLRQQGWGPEQVLRLAEDSFHERSLLL
jgi:glutamyl/glutaminyl-tRNA synthetase